MYHMRYVRETVAKCVGSTKCAYYPVYIQEYVNIRLNFTPNRLNFGYSGSEYPVSGSKIVHSILGKANITLFGGPKPLYRGKI